MIIAAIDRPNGGQFVISLDQHPRDGSSYVNLTHVRSDESVTQRTALRPSELTQVAAALTLAAQTLTARRAQHRTISASDEIELDKRLF